MSEFIEKLSMDPLLIKIGIFIAILVFFSILKKLVKIVLILIFIFICYIFYSVSVDRDTNSDIDFLKEKIENIDIEKTVNTTKETTTKIIEEVKESIQ